MEKEGYRENLAMVRARFGDQDLLTAKDISSYLGMNVRTVYTHFTFREIGKGKRRMLRITVPDFVRQLSV